jgi:NADH:ubiquinone oxidoreductase subunit 5 (subunit L)/multisubunit Na+/H+ antiporter MnhA subunit
MITLVMGSNLLIMFIGWEGVGLCSYLLIGFWHKNQDYNDACEAHKKGKSVKISGKLVTVGRSKVIETATFQIIH